MRLSGGAFRGRILRVPPTGLRPTSEKVRQALFNILGPVTGWRVLDLYAGSGAVAIEAISRGASSADLVEQDKRSVAVIRKNVAMLGLDCPVYPQQVVSFLGSRHEPVYDFIFLDPPYQHEEEKRRLALSGIAGVLNPGGVLVFEASVREDPPIFPLLSVVDTRKYGDTALHFYKLTVITCDADEDMV